MTAPGAAPISPSSCPGIAIFGVFLFLTYYMQVIKGDSPLTTGLLFLPMIGCILISSNLSSIVRCPGSARAP